MDDPGNGVGRLPEPYGRWLDRQRRITFRFEGETYTGYAGDTLSTALWANGVRVLGRSFKYHRPRGIWGLSGIDANVLVEDAASTNVRGDHLALRDGMDLRAVNTVGGVRNDALRILGHFGALTPVGFYYKAFHTPKWLFPLYEKVLRGLGGLGRINAALPIKHTPKRCAFCDVLVVGGGPSGLSSAIAAARHGAEVLLVDENPYLGGSLQYRCGGGAESPLNGLKEQVAALPSITCRVSTVAVSHDADNWVALVDDQAMTKVRARTVVYACGCHEQPAVFRNNDLPGVMLAGAAQRLLHLYAVRPFRTAVILAANPEAYETALDLHHAGVAVRAVADPRPEGESSAVAGAVADAGIPVRTGTCIYEAIPLWGNRGVAAAAICALDGHGVPRPETAGPRGSLARAECVACDGIVMGVGYAPADGLLRQAGGRMRYEAALNQFVPEELPSAVYAAGKVNGLFDLAARMADGAAAGEEAAAALGLFPTPQTARPARPAIPHSHPYPIYPHPKGHAFVDLDEDVQVKDIEMAFQEGFDSIELLKRYSTFGMGPSQGKHSNLNALRILARLRCEDLALHRLPTARPYAQPVPLSHLAGRIFTPYSRTTLHAWHERHGAEFTFVGSWLRPKYYRVEGHTEEACIAVESLHVRQNAGLIDVGTLGKLEVNGPDAAAFLERTYTGAYASMKVGTARYGLMCDDTGVIINDGIIARLAEDRFYVTATTTGVEAVYREMRRNALAWQCNCVIADVTSSYGAISLAGPRSRDVLASVADIATTGAGFPHLGVRQTMIAGVPARVLRLGFVSKLGCEIHVPSDGAPVVWDTLMRAGAAHDIGACGVEAQRLLRLEMGHFIIGQDTDALTHPYELGMDWALKMDKPYFIGQRSLRVLNRRPIERRLVGFVLNKDGEDNVPGRISRIRLIGQGVATPCPAENHLVIANGDIAGRVTSIYRSPSLRQVIGLAYVAPSQVQPGAEIHIRSHGGEMVKATVVQTPFYR